MNVAGSTGGKLASVRPIDRLLVSDAGEATLGAGAEPDYGALRASCAGHLWDCPNDTPSSHVRQAADRKTPLWGVPNGVCRRWPKPPFSGERGGHTLRRMRGPADFKALPDVLREQASKIPDRTFLHWQGRTVTYKEFDE